MKKFLFFLTAAFLCVNISAQKKNSHANNNVNEYKDQIKMMVKYLEDTFSFIGDPENTTQEKDIIFRESYLKIFKDDKVQIEDDLDEHRRTAINKDIQAYLKDIDFFFKDITFSLNVENIEVKTNENNETYFFVTTMRTMNGHNISGDTVNDRRKRFMEINLDHFKKELKIASIYTTKPNENEELRNWWNKMPLAWKQYLGENNFLFDTIEMKNLSHIYKDSIVISTYADDMLIEHTIAADMNVVYSKLSSLSKTTEVDVSYNTEIHSLDPLQEMSEITNLDCSNTDIFDVSPIRNLNKIKNLNISNTEIDDISSLKYNSEMLVLRADNIPIKDIETVECFTMLTNLSIAGVQTADIKPLNYCTQLTHLDISGTQVMTLDSVYLAPTMHNLNLSGTGISDLTPIAHLENLQGINMDYTQVTDLSPLSNMHKLNEIQCSNTKVADIMPLKDLPQLIRIYCDNTNIDSKKASEFSKANNKVMVIFETETLRKWWDDLPVYWKTALTKQTSIDINPTPEELHSLIQIKSLEVDAAIQDATPINRLTSLEKLVLSNTKIIDIEPLRGLLNIKHLEMKNTKIQSLQPLDDLTNLQELNIENTLISDLSPLQNMSNLSMIYAENSKITPETVYNLKVAQPQVTVIYQTERLRSWWNTLDNSWRDILKEYVSVDANPTAEQLQRLADITEIEVRSNTMVSSLEPVSRLHFIKKLVVKDNQLTDLSPLANMRLLEVLDVSGNAIDDITVLGGITTVTSLSIENTIVTDISVVENMPKLKVLNIANTSVKNIKALTNCKKLEELNIANTPVKTLSPIMNTTTLKHIKAFNSKVKKKDIESLRKQYPEINIVYY
ncbi:MAG: leucine-rich repeat domain-containing protein [Bacteroidales bacterium]|nr:leucine-rich repeat domain-containing protein [Bacteroidales bacterium]